MEYKDKIIDIKFVHVVKRGQLKTLCSMSTENILKYKWMHPIESYKKKLIVHKELDMPTCPDCIKILKLYEIKIETKLEKIYDTNM